MPSQFGHTIIYNNNNLLSKISVNLMKVEAQKLDFNFEVYELTRFRKERRAKGICLLFNKFTLHPSEAGKISSVL